MKKRIFLVSLLTALLMVMFFSPALAKKPTKTLIYESHESYDFGCNEFDFDFDLHFEEDWEVIGTTFFDKDDNPVRIQAQVTIKGTLLNTGTGTVMRSFGRVLFSEDLTGKKEAFDTGVHIQAIAPNKGVVAKWMGLVIFDEAGTFKGVEQPPFRDVKAFCEGLKDI